MSARAYGVLLVGFILRAQAASAQSAGPVPELPLRVTVDAVRGCPDRAAFLARVRSYAPRVRNATADENASTMRVILRAERAGVFGTLRVKEADGEEGIRQVRGADCASVSEGLAFVAAVIMDPATARTSAAESAPARSASGARFSSSPVRLSAGAAIEIATGLGIDPEGIARIFVDFDFPGLVQGASLRTGVGRGYSSSISTGPTSATFALTDVRVEPCLAIWSKAPVSLLGCGVMQVIVNSGQADSAGTASQADSHPSVELGLGLRPMWNVGDRIALGLLVGAAVPTARYRFYFSPSDTLVYRLSAWSAFGQFSAGVYFW